MEAGDSVLVIEHNLDVIKTADYVIDLGPEGGDQGGMVVAKGTLKNSRSRSLLHRTIFEESIER